MTTYAVKRSLPGITMEQLGASQKAAIATGNQLTEEAVRAVNEKAAIPFDEITEVLDLVP